MTTFLAFRNSVSSASHSPQQDSQRQEEHGRQQDVSGCAWGYRTASSALARGRWRCHNVEGRSDRGILSERAGAGSRTISTPSCEDRPRIGCCGEVDSATLGELPLHVARQSIPAGLEITVPVPAPALLTVTVKFVSTLANAARALIRPPDDTLPLKDAFRSSCAQDRVPELGYGEGGIHGEQQASESCHMRGGHRGALKKLVVGGCRRPACHADNADIV